jgi:hypothetical protein
MPRTTLAGGQSNIDRLDGSVNGGEVQCSRAATFATCGVWSERDVVLYLIAEDRVTLLAGARECGEVV